MTQTRIAAIWMAIGSAVLAAWFVFAELPLLNGTIIADAPFRKPDGTMGMKAIDVTVESAVIAALAIALLIGAIILWRKGAHGT